MNGVTTPFDKLRANGDKLTGQYWDGIFRGICLINYGLLSNIYSNSHIGLIQLEKRLLIIGRPEGSSDIIGNTICFFREPDKIRIEFMVASGVVPEPPNRFLNGTIYQWTERRDCLPPDFPLP